MCGNMVFYALYTKDEAAQQVLNSLKNQSICCRAHWPVNLQPVVEVVVVLNLYPLTLQSAICGVGKVDVGIESVDNHLALDGVVDIALATLDAVDIIYRCLSTVALLKCTLHSLRKI